MTPSIGNAGWLLGLGVLLAMGVAWGGEYARRGMMIEQPLGLAPRIGEPEVNPAIVAPPMEYRLPPLPEGMGDSLSGAERITLQGIRVSGSTLFGEETWSGLTAPLLHRPVTLAELFELRDRITHLYIDRGYVSSGAVIPEQDIESKILEIQVVEGRLSAIQVQGNRFLDADWITSRLERGAGVPLSTPALEEQFQLLRQNDLIRAIHSELRPGARPGDAVLNVRVEEANPWRAGLAWHNQISPNLGLDKYELTLANRSVLGWNDPLMLKLGTADGQNDHAFSYAIPLNARDTTFSLSMARTTSTVTVPPFDALDIISRSRTYDLSLRHPMHRTPLDEVAISLGFERHESRTYLLGQPFDLTAGTDNGAAVVHIIDFGQEWIHRQPNQVMALLSRFGKGVDVGNSTAHHGDNLPDSNFLVWRGQFQWLRQLALFNSQMQWRNALRLASRSMLATEKFSIGGLETVRGYREGLVSRDGGFVTNLDWRIPLPWRWTPALLGDARSDGGVNLVLFGDYGTAWDHGVVAPKPRDLSSVGVGWTWSINRNSQAALYLAKSLRTTTVTPDQREMPDHGIHFRVDLATY
ncbi:MAG: ShlB/FhaC/HecB family hemolysin secretion/activation protein [Magnetococcales bacterium]|nr:ShlB/FhaC/HecB family hemolysin secretion/activation protein [Magnetococcales bacterium]